MQYKLAILIPTLSSRWVLFSELYGELLHQIRSNNLLEEVTIRYESDAGDISTGKKRNKLKRGCRDCEFIMYHDDDDWPAEDYVLSVYKAIIDNPRTDCVNFQVIFTLDGTSPRLMKFSKIYPSYIQEIDCYKRPPGILSAIRRKKVFNINFPDISVGEDVEWAMEIANKKIIRKEVNINRPLYNYRYNSTKKLGT